MNQVKRIVKNNFKNFSFKSFLIVVELDISSELKQEPKQEIEIQN